MIKLGIDIHGVSDADQEFFSELTKLLVQNGHEVHILTGSEHTQAFENHLKNDLKLYWTHLFSITSFHLKSGTEVSSINGNPYMEEDMWNRTKAQYCKKHGIQLHLDDSAVYGKFFQTPYGKYYSNQQPETRKKIAVIGGSFNPVTQGHISMAEAVLDAVHDIYQIWLMPAFRHPFEKHKEYCPERIKMIRLIESEKIRYFGYEIDNKLFGETFATFTRLLDDPDYKNLYDFHMVIGSDCVLDFDRKWKHAGLLSKLIKFIIIPRPGYDLENYKGLLSCHPHIILGSVKTPDISASKVRKHIRQNKSIKGLVPDAIETYIIEKQLFKNQNIISPNTGSTKNKCTDCKD
ncbi:Nicotinate-nucleotide adenylyltransferase [Desulfonema limicola]|uniref:Probable nicotinate-nucleotide adenylyltransferase n=1 Tax=Desulfonema limicola TaxID=45656 RepID=A0A975B991_9BACT|nr:nicotinate (nicotinamide) nucleotide adenylyltransferase [Desulfonema limicola]QTA81130.1 Nicotinate-nucleotide adenylyltransferase [Desulfonema limicola]